MALLVWTLDTVPLILATIDAFKPLMWAAALAFLAATLVRSFPAMAAFFAPMASALARTTAFTLAPITTGATAILTPTAAALAARASLAAKIPFPIAAPLMAPAMAPAMEVSLLENTFKQVD